MRCALLIAILLCGVVAWNSGLCRAAPPADKAADPQADPKAKTATPAVAELIAQLGNEEPKVRREAALELGKLGADAAAALERLTELSQKDEYVTVRQAAKASADKIRSAVAKPPPAKKAPPTMRKTDTDFVYEKKTAAVWLRQLNSTEPEERRAVVTALRTFGLEYPNTLPALVTLLRDRDASVRAAAAHAIGGFGPPAKAAVTVLTSATTDPDPDVREAALLALGKMGSAAKSAAPVLLTQMRSAPPKGLELLAETVEAVGGSLKPVMPRLVAMLRDKEPDVRAAAVAVMGRMRTEAAPEVPRLFALSDDPSTTVSQAATEALKRLTPDIVPELTTTLSAPGTTDARKLFVLTQLAELPEKVRPEKLAPAVATLLTMMGDRNPQVSAAAEKILISTGPVGAAKVGELLRSEDYATRRGAAAYLIKQGPTATRPTVRNLIPLLLEPGPGLRESIRAGLIALEADGLAAVTEVARDAKAKPELRVAVIGLLTAFGEERMPAGLATALELTKDPDAAVRAAAAKVVTDQRQASIEFLIASLKADDAEKVAAAMKVLAAQTAGPTSAGLPAEFVAPLMAKAFSGEAAVAKSAGELLLKCPIKEVLSALQEGLASPETARRRRSAELLGELGPAAIPALPALNVAAEDVDSDVAAAVAEAIRKINK